MSTIQSIIFPFAYNVRALVRNSRVAQRIKVYEDQVFDIPNWNQEHAVLAIRATMYSNPGFDNSIGEEIEYRVARCSDGIVRLVAPLWSSAVLSRAVEPGNLLSHHFIYPGNWNYEETEPVRANSIDANILGDDKDLRQNITNRIVDNLCMVEGVLHIACKPPLWNYKNNIMGSPHLTYLSANSLIHASYHNYHENVPISIRGPFNHEDARRFYHTENNSMENYLANNNRKVTDIGTLDVALPEVFKKDVQWIEMLRLSHNCLGVAEKTISEMFDDERTRYNKLQYDMSFYPHERNQLIAENILKTSITIHGIKQMDRAGLRTDVERAYRNLLSTPAPRPLDSRIGIALPTLDDIAFQPENGLKI